MLSNEGLNYLFPFVITVDGKNYEQMIPGRVARIFAEESEETAKSYSQEESNNIFKTAFLLFANQVDAATTFAQNCGGGGSAPDKDWGLDENEEDILWACRCFRKAADLHGGVGPLGGTGNWMQDRRKDEDDLAFWRRCVSTATQMMRPARRGRTR